MLTIETGRLRLREAIPQDADFLARLMNEPDYLTIVGDWNVRTSDDAVTYMRSAAIYEYGSEGLGFNIIELGLGGERVGICGLVRREPIGDIELGYAVSAAHRGKGYASEAAAATLDHAHRCLRLERVVSVVDLANKPSREVLAKIGMGVEVFVRGLGSGMDRCIYVSDRRSRPATLVGIESCEPDERSTAHSAIRIDGTEQTGLDRHHGHVAGRHPTTLLHLCGRRV